MSSHLRVTRAGVRFTLVAAGSALTMSSASLPSPYYSGLAAEIGFAPVMVTVIFAIYAITLLLALLTAGSLSSHVGRRPVMCAGFALLALFAVMFGTANTTAALVVARAVQGISCGLLLTSLSATTVDLGPQDRPELVSICNSILPLVGLALGALAGGFCLDMLSNARVDVFGGLAVISILSAVAVWALPETSPRLAGAWRSLQPKVRIPGSARTTFWRVVPALFASWSTGGLYLSLGGMITAGLFGLTRGTEQGAVLSLLSGGGALACLLFRNVSPFATLRYGTLALALGTALSLLGAGLESVTLYLVGMIIGGTGFGATFYGAVRSVVVRAAPRDRGDVFSAIYTVSYLVFSVPTVLAGMVLPRFGLIDTTIGYGVMVILSALAATLLNRRQVAESAGCPEATGA